MVEVFQLRGMGVSDFGVHWYPDYRSKSKTPYPIMIADVLYISISKA